MDIVVRRVNSVDTNYSIRHSVERLVCALMLHKAFACFL